MAFCLTPIEYGGRVPKTGWGGSIFQKSLIIAGIAIPAVSPIVAGVALIAGVPGRLYRLGRARPSERQALARQYVAEALAGEGELTVTGVELGDGGTLRVYLEWHGQTLAVTVETGGT